MDHLLLRSYDDFERNHITIPRSSLFNYRAEMPRGMLTLDFGLSIKYVLSESFIL